MESILIKTINGEKTSRPPVWFMRQAGRILPNYMKLKESYTFHELMNDKDLASKVTLLPINDLSVDAAILFSDILVIPHALGLGVEFKKTGPVFKNPLNIGSKSRDLNFNSKKLDYIYKNIKQVNIDKAILARQYDYIGHVIRQTVRNPGCLLKHALDYKDKL